MFRSIVARFPGTCKRCQGPIVAGQTIRYGGRGLTYHLKADCRPGRLATDQEPDAITDAVLAQPDAEYPDAPAIDYTNAPDF